VKSILTLELNHTYLFCQDLSTECKGTLK